MQGKTIKGFELKKILGTGGMAEVWLAENEIGKKVAVKLMLPMMCANDDVKSRFYTEAKLMVNLNHPNIRQVYDYGELEGRPAIIMEYLEGEDLKTRLRNGQRFTQEELEQWWNQLVSALNYTHQRGVVHRDIKPGNIFVDNNGNIKLLDFGIAKVRENITSTQTGQKLGTLMYMSPEQVKDSKHIDYRTDIYSLAVTFIHLITGKKPYDSESSSDFEISVQIVYKSLDLSALPVIWQNFLAPYLEKDPDKRMALRNFTITQDAFQGHTQEAAPSRAHEAIQGSAPEAARNNVVEDNDENTVFDEKTVLSQTAPQTQPQPQPRPVKQAPQKAQSSAIRRKAPFATALTLLFIIASLALLVMFALGILVEGIGFYPEDEMFDLFFSVGLLVNSVGLIISAAGSKKVKTDASCPNHPILKFGNRLFITSLVLWCLLYFLASMEW